jgi:hypothetical protein
MSIISVRRRVSPFASALVLLLQVLPALAAGQPGAQQASIQGGRVPGMPVPSTDTKRDKHRGPVEVTFTKWRTAVLPPPPAAPSRRLFKGFVGGDLGAGGFVAEVLDRKDSTACTAVDPSCAATTPPTITASISSLEAIYEVQVGERSFTAVIQGGSTSAGGRLEGVVVSGWRLGAHVRVAFDQLTTCTDRDGVSHGPCFAGTIRVGRAPDK